MKALAIFPQPALDLTKRVSDKIKKGSDAVGQRWLAVGWVGGWIHQQRALRIGNLLPCFSCPMFLQLF